MGGRLPAHPKDAAVIAFKALHGADIAHKGARDGTGKRRRVAGPQAQEETRKDLDGFRDEDGPIVRIVSQDQVVAVEDP